MRVFVKASVFLVLALALVLSNGGVAHADRRVALVIGNSNYAFAGALPSTLDHANAIAELLSRIGFDVVQRQSDLGNVEFWRALDNFSELSFGADIALFFYSGYALSIGGVDYLVPVDAKLSNVATREEEAVSLGWVFSAADNARTLSLVLIDACRESPFHPGSAALPAPGAPLRLSDLAPPDVSPGLAEATPRDSNTLIAFADKRSSVCVDGEAPFAAALVKHLAEPGLDVRDALAKVRDEVMQATGNRQQPSVYGSLGARVSLASREATGGAPIAVPDKAPPSAAPDQPAPRVATDAEAGAPEHSSSAAPGAAAGVSSAPALLSLAGEDANRASNGATSSGAQDASPPPAAAEVESQPSSHGKADETPPVEPAPPPGGTDGPSTNANPALAEQATATTAAAQGSSADAAPGKAAAVEPLSAGAAANAAAAAMQSSTAETPSVAPLPAGAVADAGGSAPPDARPAGPQAPPGAASSAKKVAALSGDEACDRDERRLARLRGSATSEEARRFADELGCEKLRPELARLIESLGEALPPPPSPTPDRPAAESSAAPAARPPADCRAEQNALSRLRAAPSAQAAQRFWQDLRCERLRPQVRLLLESLNLLADPPSACRREAKELNRIRMNPDRPEAERFARTITCDALKPQAARLLESLAQ